MISVFSIVVSLPGRKHQPRVSELTAHEKCTIANLRNTIVSSAQFGGRYYEPHLLRYSHDLSMLKRTEKLGDIFHYEYLCSASFNDFQEWPPKFLPVIRTTILVQQTEALTRGTANDDIGLWNADLWVLQQTRNVADYAMFAKVGVVRSRGEFVEIVGPDGCKRISELRAESQRQAAGAAEQINQAPRFGDWPVLHVHRRL
jgi:hypothetical protein